MQGSDRLLARLTRLPITYRAAELLVEGGATWEAAPTPRPMLEGARGEVDAALAGLRLHEGSRPLGAMALPSAGGSPTFEQAMPGASSPLVAFARSPGLDLRLDHDARAFAVWTDGLASRFASAAFDSAWHYLEVVARLGADRLSPDWSRAPKHLEVWFQGVPVERVVSELELDPIPEGTGPHAASWESPMQDAALIELRVVGMATHGVVVLREPEVLSRVLRALDDAVGVEVWLPRGRSSPIDPRFRPIEIGAASLVLARGGLAYWTHDRSALHHAALVGASR